MRMIIRSVCLLAFASSSVFAADDPRMDLKTSIQAEANVLAPGHTTFGDSFLEGEAPKEATRTVKVEYGRCYWFIAKGESPPFFMNGAPPMVKGITLALLDKDQKVAAQNKTDDAFVTLGYCPPMTQTLTLKVSAAGKGRYALGAFSKPGSVLQIGIDGKDRSAKAPTVVEDKVKPLKDALLPRMEKALPGVKFHMPFIIEVDAGPPKPNSGWFMHLKPNMCYWVLGMGEKTVDGIALVLTGPDDKSSGPMDEATDKIVVVKNMEKGEGTVLGYCPPAAGRYRLHAMGTGTGKFVMGQFSRAGKPGDVAPNGMPAKR